MGMRHHFPCVTSQAKVFLLTQGHYNSCLISPKHPGPSEAGSVSDQEKREQGDSDKLVETTGEATPWKEKHL